MLNKHISGHLAASALRSTFQPQAFARSGAAQSEELDDVVLDIAHVAIDSEGSCAIIWESGKAERMTASIAQKEFASGQTKRVYNVRNTCPLLFKL